MAQGSSSDFFFFWTHFSPVNYILFLIWNAGTWEPATRPRGPIPPALWLSASEFRGHRAEWLETDVLGQQMQLLIELKAGDSGWSGSGCMVTSRIHWRNVTSVSPAGIRECCQTTLTHRTRNNQLPRSKIRTDFQEGTAWANEDRRYGNSDGNHLKFFS